MHFAKTIQLLSFASTAFAIAIANTNQDGSFAEIPLQIQPVKDESTATETTNGYHLWTILRSTVTVTEQASATPTALEKRAKHTSTRALAVQVAQPASTCLSDSQATSIVNSLSSALTNPDRVAAESSLNDLIASTFVEISDSVNSLSGWPLNSTSSPTKDAFVARERQSPAIGRITTLGQFHGCNEIAWNWVATGIGANLASVRGITLITVTGINSTPQISKLVWEFNSIAWGLDIGWTCGAGFE